MRLAFERLDFRRLGLPDFTGAGGDRREYEFRLLAQYHVERSHGLVHTEDWKTVMAREKTRFDFGERSQIREERMFLAINGHAARIGDVLPEVGPP